MKQYLRWLALAVAIVGLGFSSCSSGLQAQKKSAPGQILMFDYSNAMSMRGYYVMLGLEFFDGPPPSVFKEVVESCGEGAIFPGVAVTPGTNIVTTFCHPKDHKATLKTMIEMCIMLGIAIERPLVLVEHDNDVFYCGEPGQSVTGA